MSISNEITRLQTAKANLKSAIENKGVTVPSATKLDGYASLVDGIETMTVDPISITSNGTYSASSGHAYSPVTVSIPTFTPTGTLSITENGTYNVEAFAQAEVMVSGGGGITADDIAMRTISGVVSGSAVRVVDYAFRDCPNLSTASFPQVSSIGGYAFNYCTNLTTVSFPQASSIGIGAFQYCSNLSTASFPQVSYMETSAFQYCSKLTTASFPQVRTIGNYAFAYCRNLTTAIFNNASTTQGTIYTYAFRNCYHLISLYLLASTLYRLSVSHTTFQSTPISNYTTSTGGVHGSIFVPQSLYDAYISSTNWSYFSSRFVSLTDEQVDYVMEHGTHIME